MGRKPKQLVESHSQVGDNISASSGGWTFSGGVTETFSQHVQKSVPLYNEGHDLICRLSDFFLPPETDTICYELGTSNGDLLQKLALHNQAKSRAKFVGIDIVPEMTKTAEKRVKNLPNAHIVTEDFTTFEFAPSDLIISYYSIQFVHPRVRQQVINTIYESLNWGGGFLLFEKVRAPDARFQDMMTSLYSDFKTDNGFSAEEIVGKSKSLRGVLEPFSTEGNLGLLKRAGFVDIMTVMKWSCFEGFLAIK